MSLLEIKALSKSFGGLMALFNLDFEVDEKEIVGLIGPNGSGKTTLFNAIMGSFRCDQGSILFRSQDITGLKPYQVCEKGIARTFQLTKPFNRMSCLENVMVGRSFGKDPACGIKEARREAGDILKFVGLEGKQQVPASALNLIERRRLELARALATRPQLLLLDEIMGGLNPTEIKMAVGLIRQINRSGVTVVIVEHVVKALLGISERVVVLDAGEKIAEGPPKEIVQNQDVIKAYFGKNLHA
ncbi:MAG: transporter ATP-binding protein [Deltaproteobacteria bacterium]|nr:transporter ATP-binding protein [Deltaproteobacteria bacterium]